MSDTPAKASPTVPGGSRNTYFDFQAKVFQAPGACFMLKGNDKLPMFVVEMGGGQGIISLADLRKALYAAHPHFARIDAIEGGSINIANAGALGTGAFTSAVQDFYLTNPIARASAVMAECSALAKGRLQQAAE